MFYTEFRKLSLKVFIGFLALTALIAIVSVLTGDMGEIQVKILATTFTISAASICSMSCAAFIEKRKTRRLGLSGILLTLISAILVIIGIWLSLQDDIYWKITGTVVIATVAFAHAFLMLLPKLDEKQKWLQTVSMYSIGILAVQITVAVWGEIENDGYYRFLTVVAIIVGLETLVIPILMKLRGGQGSTKGLLMLENIEGEMYKDSAGKMYSVKEIDKEQIHPADKG
jgi:predicted nucleic acid-binding Zn ribbon protein